MHFKFVTKIYNEKALIKPKTRVKFERLEHKFYSKPYYHEFNQFKGLGLFCRKVPERTL